MTTMARLQTAAGPLVANLRHEPATLAELARIALLLPAYGGQRVY